MSEDDGLGIRAVDFLRQQRNLHRDRAAIYDEWRQELENAPAPGADKARDLFAEMRDAELRVVEKAEAGIRVFEDGEPAIGPREPYEL